MTNPFEDPDASYCVLLNDEEQYSLWPAAMAVPDGWSRVFGDAPRDACVAYVDEQWTDMRPKSLRESMGGL